MDPRGGAHSLWSRPSNVLPDRNKDGRRISTYVEDSRATRRGDHDSNGANRLILTFQVVLAKLVLRKIIEKGTIYGALNLQLIQGDLDLRGYIEARILLHPEMYSAVSAPAVFIRMVRIRIFPSLILLRYPPGPKDRYLACIRAPFEMVGCKSCSLEMAIIP